MGSNGTARFAGGGSSDSDTPLSLGPIIIVMFPWGKHEKRTD